MLAACGNPHLTAVDGIESKTLPTLATPSELASKGLRVEGEFNLKTENSSAGQTVKLQNLDESAIWSTKFEFEKGTNFQFNGTSFPGDKGNCRDEIKGSENCLLDIQFSSNIVGFFADNLIVTYSNISDPKEIYSLTYPLRGERISKAEEAISKISVKTISGEGYLDFGKTVINSQLSAKVIVSNEGDTEVKLSASLSSNSQIQFTEKTYPGKEGTCTSQLESGKTCLLEVSFDAEAKGLYQDTLNVVHSPLPKGKKETVSFSIIGEKIPKKIQGPLVASEVFSNTLDFGKVKLGVEVKKQFEIQNLGETSYSVKELILTNPKVFKYTGDKFPGTAGTCGDIILPGSCLIEVSFRPIEVKKVSGLFKIDTNEGDSVEVKLSGEGAEDRLCESYHEFLIVPEKSYPASEVIFPYLKSHPSSTAALTQIYGLNVNTYIKSIDTYTVKDGMVYVTYKLPKLDGDIINMNFGVHVLKVIDDNYKDTESLCLSSSSVRKCSGHQFELASWQKLRNPKFWDNFTTPVSERYERQFASGEKKCGTYNCMNLNTQYELSDIFELSAEEMKSLRKDGVMTLVFSDDTRMLKMPRIAVKTKVKVSCE